MQKKVSKMNLADAETAEELVSRHAATTEAEADKGSERTVRCLRQFVPSAVRRPQSPLNRVEIGRYIVGIVSVIGETVTKASITGNSKRSGYGPLFIVFINCILDGSFINIVIICIM